MNAKNDFEMRVVPSILHSLLFFLCALFVSQHVQAQGWRRVGQDLEMLQREAVSAGLFTPQVTFFRTALETYDLQVLRARDFGRQRMSVASLCRLSRASLCINANFFDENGESLGLVIHRGIQLEPIHKGGSTLTAVLTVTRNNVDIVHRSSFNPKSSLEALQAGPRLVKDSRAVSGLNDNARSRRSGVCIDKNKRIIVFITSSNFAGLSFSELQQELLRSEIDCIDALNLDGGGSSQLFLSSEITDPSPGLSDLHIAGRDEVPVVLALTRKESK
jgi:uncharacterized protein YigE (DUF2233 family)